MAVSGLGGAAQAAELVRIQVADHAVGTEISMPALYGSIVKAADQICAAARTTDVPIRAQARAREQARAKIAPTRTERRLHESCVRHLAYDAVTESRMAPLQAYQNTLPRKVWREHLSAAMAARVLP